MSNNLKAAALTAALLGVWVFALWSLAASLHGKPPRQLSEEQEFKAAFIISWLKSLPEEEREEILREWRARRGKP
jgi:hypothetical protein